MRQARGRSEEIFSARQHGGSEFRDLPDARGSGGGRQLQGHEVWSRKRCEGRSLLHADGDGERAVRADGSCGDANAAGSDQPRVWWTGSHGPLAGRGPGEDQWRVYPTQGLSAMSDRKLISSGSTFEKIA